MVVDIALVPAGRVLIDDVSGDDRRPSKRERDSAEMYHRAAETHRRAAAQHAEAAEWWESRGDLERADLERRSAALERDAEQLALDWAALKERHAPLRLG